MKYIGATKEEALENAAQDQGVSVNELVYEVIGENEACVQIEVYEIVDIIEYAQTYLKEAIESIGIDCRVTPSLKDDIIHLKVDSNHNSILIGKNGKTLQSLNELTRIAVSNHFKKRYRILLDINGYKNDKYDRLCKMARRIGHEVQKTKTNVTLDPMPADERRVIHNTLTNMPNIKTESTGFGKQRQIQVIYVESDK
ncbi:MAG: KH domain-containing protein [Erysipelotrichaceae bacterium]|nr:KH domain-containing protein [Erysipelotrichaceae bacterium]